jgi:hypothetical protein
MTRKDYILLAEALRVEYKRASLPSDCLVSANDKVIVLQVAASLADSLARDNTRFNQEHILAGVKGEKALLCQTARPKCYGHTLRRCTPAVTPAAIVTGHSATLTLLPEKLSPVAFLAQRGTFEQSVGQWDSTGINSISLATNCRYANLIASRRAGHTQDAHPKTLQSTFVPAC